MMTRRSRTVLAAMLLALSAVFTVFFHRYAVDISGTVLSVPVEAAADSSRLHKPAVAISVVSRYPPNIIYSGYQPMLDYLTANTRYRFELRLCDDYNQAVQLLLEGEAAAAFLGSYVYIKARKEHGVVPVLKPLNSNREPFSRSVLFTRGDSPVFGVKDLRGRTLALPSAESYSANWLLQTEFVRHGIAPKDLKGIVNFPHHQSVIHNVLAGAFDAGVTREYLIARMRGRGLRVLLYSDPFPTSPLVVAKEHDPRIVAEIRRVLLALGPDRADLAEITRGWDNEFVNGFVPADDREYDAIRTLVNAAGRTR